MNRISFIGGLALACLTSHSAGICQAQNTASTPKPDAQKAASNAKTAPAGTKTTTQDAKSSAAAKSGKGATPRPQPVFHPPASLEGQQRGEEIDREIGDFWLPAQEAYKAGRLAEAERLCLQATAVHNKYYNFPDSGGRRFLGKIYLKGGQYQKALACFHDIFENCPDEQLHTDMAFAYCRLGNFAEARRLYLAPIVQEHITSLLLEYGFSGKKANPDNLPAIDDAEGLYASVLLLRGFSQMTSSEPAEAITSFQQADQLRPKNPMVHLYWGITLHNLERYSEAIPHFRVAAQRGNGVVVKAAQGNLVRAQQSVEGLKRWQEQQAKKQTASPSVAPAQPPTPATPKP